MLEARQISERGLPWLLKLRHGRRFVECNTNRKRSGMPRPTHWSGLLFSTLAAVLVVQVLAHTSRLPIKSNPALSVPRTPRPEQGSENVQVPSAYVPRTRQYFLAAEPVEWDYAPLGRDKLGLALPKPWRDNRKYRKYRYFQYTDDTFTTAVKQPAWLGILGPIIRGVVGDTLKVTFLNRSDREDRIFSMHPHGLRYDRDNEGAYSYPDARRGSWVTRSSKYTYTWRVDKEAGPEPGEPSSKVWLYHSHVSADEDINWGLVGAIVITDPAHARPDGTPDDVDREFVTLFMIFNENGGLKHMNDEEEQPELQATRDAFRKLTPAAQQEVLEGGLKHTINGYIFGNLPNLEMYLGERVRWYLIALGSEQDLHTAHWHGETVVEDRRRTDDVELLPGSMKVADIKADNPGTWIFHCHVSDHMMAGMYAFYVVHPK
jgi:manganese oxidase